MLVIAQEPKSFQFLFPVVRILSEFQCFGHFFLIGMDSLIVPRYYFVTKVARLLLVINSGLFSCLDAVP